MRSVAAVVVVAFSLLTHGPHHSHRDHRAAHHRATHHRTTHHRTTHHRTTHHRALRCAANVACIERVARRACRAGDHSHCRLFGRLKARRGFGRQMRGCNQRNPVVCVDYAADRFGQSRAVAECVAHAESTDDPSNAGNPTHHGLWQFDDGTWEGTPYASRSVWSAYWSSLAAMWYWEHGQASRWTTYAGCA